MPETTSRHTTSQLVNANPNMIFDSFILNFSTVILIAYLITLVFGFKQGKTAGREPQFWNGLAIALLGLVSLAFIGALGFFPLFLGFAWFSGSLIGVLSRSRPAAKILLLASLSLPALHLWWQASMISDKAVLLAEFQQVDISGHFGDVPIKLPVSPQLRIEYICLSGDRRLERNCAQHLGFTTGLGTAVDDGVQEQRQITSIQFLPISLPSYDRRHGLNYSDSGRMGAWCVRRADLVDTVWCTSRPTSKITFSFDRVVPKNVYDRDQWVEAKETGLTFSGTSPEVLVQCNRQIYKGPMCRASFDITSDTSVQIWMGNIAEADAHTEAIAMQDIALQVWSAIARSSDTH